MELGTGAWLWRGVWSLAAAASTLHGTMCVAAGPVADWLTGTTPAPVQIGGPQPISASTACENIFFFVFLHRLKIVTDFIFFSSNITWQ
jgi:hypothetical protein